MAATDDKPLQGWEAKVKAKREQRQSSIPPEWVIETIRDDVTNVLDIPAQCGLLTEKELEITNTDVPLLLNNIAKATWTSVEVTTAFCKRAVNAQQLMSATAPK